MIQFFLALRLIAIPAEAQLATATADQQRVIMSGIATGINALKDAEAIEKAAGEIKDSDPEKWVELWAEAQRQRAVADWEFNLAIERTVDNYGIAPAGLSQYSGKEAKQGPMRGADIRWNPRFSNSRSVYFEYTDPTGSTRHGGGSIKEKESGATFADGSVVIMLDQFLMALDYEHPGPLAYLLHHESVHFEEMVTRAEDTLQAAESRAYKRSAQAAATFGLDARWVAIFENEQKKNYRALRSGQGSSAYPTADEELTIKASYEAQQAELARIRWQAEIMKGEADKARSARVLSLVRSLSFIACRREVTANEIPDTSLAEADHWSASAQVAKGEAHDESACADLLFIWALDGLSQGKRLNAGVVNQASAHFRRKAALNGLLQAARACGYDPVSDGQRLVYYTVANKPNSRRHFVEDHLTADEIRAQMTLRRVCAIASHERDLLNVPSQLNCAGGLQSLTSMPFPENVALWGDDSNCLMFVDRRILRFPLQPELMPALMKAVATDLDALESDNEKIRERNAQRLKDYEKSRGRNTGGGERNSPDKGGIDTKPAEDALDRAKKKRF